MFVRIFIGEGLADLMSDDEDPVEDGYRNKYEYSRDMVSSFRSGM